MPTPVFAAIKNQNLLTEQLSTNDADTFVLPGKSGSIKVDQRRPFHLIRLCFSRALPLSYLRFQCEQPRRFQRKFSGRRRENFLYSVVATLKRNKNIAHSLSRRQQRRPFRWAYLMVVRGSLCPSIFAPRTMNVRHSRENWRKYVASRECAHRQVPVSDGVYSKRDRDR